MQHPSSPDAAPARRFDRVDAVRGLAMVWMAVFHFCYDLNQQRLLTPVQHFLSDPFWTGQRIGIVTLFLGCAGLGQVLAQQAGQAPRRFWRRWAQVAGCALLVSAGSAWMYPQSWISFGVLHGIAAMLLLSRPLLRPALARPGLGVAVLLALAGLAALAPSLWAHPMFNGRWLNWTGLVSALPFTQDYVPVLPWLAALLGGAALGVALLRHAPGVLAGPVPGLLRPLAALGRWPLSFYMLHQPVLIGGLMIGLHFTRG